ncbi:MAG: O-methyltransferase [Treponema sp.]|nr:O-methyltransferase [Treponema sp.]
MEPITSIKRFAKTNAVPILKDDGINFICDYIREHNVKRVLEIGTAIGYSAIEFAQVADDVFVSTIEIDLERYTEAVKNINKLDLMDRITVYLGDALTTDISGEFDLIFIDAAKAQYIKFFERFKNSLAPGGVIISDNLSFHGMVEDLSLTHNYSTIKLVKKIRKYIDFLKANTEFTTTFYPIGDGMSVSRKN